ncbi:hypothetical protein [Mycolicibacterium sp. XJ870]
MAVAVAMLSGFGAGTATADSPGMTTAPLQNLIRQCDFVVEQFLVGHGTGTGSGSVDIGTPDPGTVRADVHLQTAHRNTAYQVRLIQLPRSAAAHCNAGAPGVATAVMHTDAAGTGSTTVTGPVRPGATDAFVVVEGPPAPGKVRGDVYSTTVLVKI